jgi:transmembrane sensor
MKKKIDKVINYLNGDMSDSREEDFQNWLNEDEANRKFFNEYKDVWQASLLYKKDMFRPEEAYYKINSKIKNTTAIKRILIYRIAAAIIIGFFIGGLSTYLIQNRIKLNNNISYHEISVPLGAKSMINLPDGSQIWLNAGSKLKYSNLFNVSNREVTLEGEGYFNVSKDEKLTFTVNAADLSIKAVGTIFNVKAYPDESFVKTVLIEGKVNIQKQTAKRNSKVIVLLPDQSATYFKSDAKIYVTETAGNDKKVDKINKTLSVKKGKIYLAKEVDSEIYTSWKDEYWIFKSEPLSELAKKIERRYNVIISFDSENLKNYKFSGSFKDETLEQVLNAIALSSPVMYSIKGKNIIFKEDK